MKCVVWNVKCVMWTLVVAVALAAPASFAQQANDIDAVKKRAELNSAKADLEEARKKRDMAVAERWKYRETANQERELFNEKYQESKEKVDALMSERARLFEDVRVAREDLAQVKLQAEKARAEFLSLAAGPERLETLAKFQEQGIPFKLAERVEVQNKVKKDMGLYKDDPVRIASDILAAARAELAFTREIQMEQAELVFGTSVAQGSRLRLGGLYAMEMGNAADGVTGITPSALMLPVAGEKKRTFSWQENLTPETRKEIGTAFAHAKDSAFVMLPVDVLLSTELSSELANHQEKTWKDELKEFYEGEYTDYNLVLCSSSGSPLSQNQLLKKLKKLIRENNLPPVVFHSLRHSSVTYKLKLNGGDIKSVQGDSGHSQVDMVTDVYSHIIDEDRRKNAELFEEAFYKRKNLNPNAYGIYSQEPTPPKVTVPDNIDPVLLQKVLSNPEMAALVSALAATMEK